MKVFKSLVQNLGITAIVVLATAFQNQIAQNFLYFLCFLFSWVILAAILKVDLKKDPKSPLPRWLGSGFTIINIATLVAFGYLGTAILWVFTASSSALLIEQWEKKQKAQ